ncbi:WD repeat and HMG-box DNA-binding protein 1 [Galdieria sulphuraria]|uniref:Chromosome transmission fidelity protein 4 n=1 Tax=Galdieria sulphuraria TaxID=130081 RepID=M2W945_GALSU|nr:chromosome transmission fidelity protein 4 [Galdieria sulphuraria]EME32371.1 chromosome transmission fidelity protein 4 [Galdieria sulphuraria]GJD06131.1 WD repeat and HMG-box DNA-binding protein 1 [Galdieria sulphuraria]|eukprot:XP_005708891.1 chromosome transmission fidelity protein 4 [Galdieria sulphuraria]
MLKTTERRLAWKYAHTPGKTDLGIIYSTQDETTLILTCGSDATVRAFEWRYEEAKEKSFPRRFQITYPHREDILALSVCSLVSKLVTGDKEGYLRLFHLKENSAELECVLTRTSGSIWCCAFSCSGSYVFVAGEEPGIVRIIDVADKTVVIASENAPVQAIKDLAVDPLGDYFVSVGERGAVGIWSLNQNTCILTIHNHATCASWKPDGSLLVLATSTKEIVFLERESWKVKRSFSSIVDTVPVKITCLTWRSQSNDILCGSEDGRIFLLHYGKDIEIVAHWCGDENLIEKIVWHPKWNSFVSVDAAGQLVRVTEVPVANVSDDHKTKEELNDEPTSVNDDSIEEQEQEDISCADEVSSHSNVDEETEETMLEENSVISKERAPRHFMVSSTPFDGSYSILCWNRTGRLVSRDVQSHHVVEIEFSDSSLKPLRFTDHYGFSLGCLNSAAVILASKSDLESRNVIFYRSLSSSWTSNSHWTVALDDLEIPLLLALGVHWAAVFTSRERLRIFSSSGIQTDLLKLEQRVLTILGSENDKLCIVYDNRMNDKCEFEFFQISPFGMVTSRSSRMSLPCKPSYLQWIGFRETETSFEELLAFSKTQELYMFLPYHGNTWTVVVDNALENISPGSSFFWPCYCYNNSLFGIVCKDNAAPPITLSSPPLTFISLSVSLLPFTESSLALEQQYLWEALMLSKLMANGYSAGNNMGERRKKLDKILIRLFEDSCVTNHVARAFDFASRLYSYKAYKIACQVANHHRLGALAQKVESLMDQCPEIQEKNLGNCSADSVGQVATTQNDENRVPVASSSIRTGITESVTVTEQDCVEKTSQSAASLGIQSRIQERKRKLEDGQRTTVI